MLNTIILKRYEIQKEIRKHELFVEYQGRDTQTGKNITAIVIRANIIPASEFLSRFESLSQLKFEHIPSLIEIGEADGQAVLIHETIEGKSLVDAEEFISQLEHIRSGLTSLSPGNAISMEDSLVGQTLGAYRLVGRLGQGGMATVYKVYEPALDRYVAIKVLPQFFAKDPIFVQRFRREAKAVAQLNHPNIVPIYSYGESGGITYIAMQFVMGDTLKHERGQKFNFEEALRLLLPIARALGYAHQRGIVHRDVKPSNVLLTDGNWPMLADFGLAQMTETSGRLTESGVGMGTPMYMSPEQGQGEKVDQRTDIYSLGIMLYELVTGDVPFRADTPMAIVIKHISAPMPMPRQIDPNIPDYLEALILKATAKNPDDRYQSADEMALAMEGVFDKLASAPVPLTPAASQKIEPVYQPEVNVQAKPSAPRKSSRVAIFSILGLIGIGVLGVILAGVFDSCRPSSLWPTAPWCAGSPTRLPVIVAEATPTSVPVFAPTSAPAVTNQPTSIPTAPAAVMLDDFESATPIGRSGWESYFEDNKDTKLNCFVDNSRKLRDSNYLQFQFDIAPNSWANCGTYFNIAEDWSAGQGIVFYLRSDQANAKYDIVLMGGTPDARTSYVYWTETPPESVNGWARIEIPWEKIIRAEWEDKSGAAFDPTAVTAFVIDFSTENSRQSGTFWVDDLALFGAPSAAATPESNIFMDDFENLKRTDLDSNFLEGSDTKTTCSLDDTIAYAGAASLKFHFDIAPDAWASCGPSFFDVVKDWSAGRGIAFYVHADQADITYDVNLFGSLGADETYPYELTTTPESVNGWERVEFYWKDILRADWEDNAGAPVNPASIKGFSFDLSAPQQARLSGTLWFDDFQVIP